MRNSISLCTIIICLHLKVFTSRADPEPFPEPGNEIHSSEEISVPQSPGIKGETTENIALPPGKLIKTLECLFQGTPTPKIVWLINGKNIQPPYEEEYLPREGKSILKFPEHQQIQILGRRTNYSCLAANFLGHTMKSFVVTEESGPVPVQLPVASHSNHNNPTRVRVK